MQGVEIDKSPSLRESLRRFATEIEDWIECCVASYRDEPASDCHDQATFTISWAPLIRRGRGRAGLSFMKAYRDRIRNHFAGTGQWKHGYWKRQEVHHGTEHFELFVGTFHKLAPDEGETAAQLLDAAEHLGNWQPDVPQWFNWDTGLFRSMYLGTEVVREEPPLTMNVPDHFRCVNIALLAAEISNDDRYLQLAELHAGRWADAILAGGELPAVLNADETASGFESGIEAGYRKFAGQAPELHTEIDRAENFLASGAIDAFLNLWKQTGNDTFRQAAERLIDVLATQLDDPDAGSAADAVRKYYRATGDSRYSAAVIECPAASAAADVRELSLDAFPPVEKRKSGIGKRGDAPPWFEDGKPRSRSPITMALKAELTGDERLACEAVDMARAYFKLARTVYPDGREHGCSARTVNAIARGHGRENNAGVITAVFDTVADCFGFC